MQRNQIIAALERERDAIDTALKALNGRKPMGVVGNGRRHRRKMSPEAKKRISEQMKKAWAERKRKAA